MKGGVLLNTSEKIRGSYWPPPTPSLSCSLKFCCDKYVEYFGLVICFAYFILKRWVTKIKLLK